MHKVQIFLGSKSDIEVVRDSGLADILDEVGVPWSATVCSAHRNPDELAELVATAVGDGARVYIGVAGMAAALPGAVAANLKSIRPVIAVPLDEHGIDSCLEMPPGVPVNLVGVGGTGLKKAAIAACQMLSLQDEHVEGAFVKYLEKTVKQPETDIDLRKGAISK